MICDGCNVREPFEHRCHGEDAPCACEDCREEDRLFERSCRKHPQWSGMSFNCIFCAREADNGSE